MTKMVMAIYERGLIRPLHKLPLANKQRIRLSIEFPNSITEATKAIIRVRPLTGKLIATSPQLSSLEG